MDLAGLRALPSADTWSFPPRPHTHHVRWIEADVSVSDRVFVAIEAGALVRTFDGGRTWRDRVRGGPYDTHTAVTHLLAGGRVYSAAGDGYFESTDAGGSWRSPEDGLKHRYLVSVAVDPADPDTVGSPLMLANQASSTPRTTAASSDQMMQDGAGRLWVSLGQSPGLQMAWRRLPVFRSDMGRRSAVVSLIVAVPDARVNESPNCLSVRAKDLGVCAPKFRRPT